MLSRTIGGYRRDMRNATMIVVGVLIALAGLLFTFQGLGAVSGSPMSNTTTWSVLGPIIALFGLLIAYFGLRGRRTSHKKPPRL